MLVLHPNSRCDVCLEGYYGPRDPIAITCGHILCQWCLQSLPKLQCPLCRHSYDPADSRKLHVDKSAIPPCTPAISSHDLDTSQATRLQSSITRVTLEGASRPELEELLQDCHDWLDERPQDQFRDLRAARHLLYHNSRFQAKIQKKDARIAEVEQTCSDLKTALDKEREELDKLEKELCDEHATVVRLDEERHLAAVKCEELEKQLEEERLIASTKYTELEDVAFEERSRAAATEKALEEDKARLQAECDEWRTKFNEVSAECTRLTDELEKIRRYPLTSRAREPRYYHPHDQKAEPAVILKDDGADSGKVKVVGTDNMFTLSPIPASKPVPEMPTNMMAFMPLSDETGDLSDDDRSRSGPPLSSASRSIPIKSKSDSHRARSGSSLLSRPDSDMASSSVPASPSPSNANYGLRADYAPGSYRSAVGENMLGLRADPARVSPSSIDSDLKENQERKQRLAVLDKLLDRGSAQPVYSVKSPRKDSFSDGSERPLPANPSNARTPSPISSAPHSYSSSTMEKELGSAPQYRPQHLGTGPVSSASSAAAERDRARASSVNSQNAPPVVPPPPSSMSGHPAPLPNPPNYLSHLTASRDRDTPVYAMYGPHPQSTPVPLQSRPSQSRRQSTDVHPPMSGITGNLSRGRSVNHGTVPPAGYTSGLTRSIRAMQEAPRVS